MTVSEEEYRLKFFLDNGFVRRKCKVCGSAYWTLDRDRETCGDAPCQDYTFIGRELKPGVDVPEVRRIFLNFFKCRGHEVVKPYPVVARWREDIYLTIASIAVFQPFVTDGVVPPPANPLVISQPCIRLVDIDNVGLTAGRHLTIFEMGGHHAFNYPDKEIYWKEETVKLCHEFLTEEIGIDERTITYKEDFWVGGGNAGPDVEVCVDGLELATLVFMCLKVRGEEYIPMNMRIVDTGYGMERFAWFLSGKPTAFHAIYGELIDAVCRDARITPPDDELLAKVAKASALMRVERGRTVDELRRELSKVTKIPLEKLEAEVAPLERVFALTDHTKCLAFMLADGVVPSNVGEGYLARLVIRRALRLCDLLRLEEGYLRKLVDEQVKIWGRDFPKLNRMRKTIMEILELEEEKYRTSINRGRSLVARVVKGLKGESLPIDALLQLYDSHGLPPEIVKEEAERLGVAVKVPDNFYGLVAKLHQSARPVKEQIQYNVSGLPPTKLLYYEDQYMFTCESRVLRSDKGYVVLDQTCFYPRGGGQEADKGFLVLGSSKLEVLDVIKIGDVVVHVVAGEVPEGAVVKCEVDAERRLGLMRHHTATHVLLEAVRRVLGEHAWQAGAQKWPDRAHLDVTHYKYPDPQQLKAIEDLANDLVLKNLPVKVSFVERERAEREYGFEIYQGGVVPGRHVRIVNIEGWNVQACGGTHVASTGEVGLIKITKVDRIQDGIIRFEYKAGKAALEYVRELEEGLHNVAQALECPVEQVSAVANKVRTELRQLRKEVEALKGRIAEMALPTILERRSRGEKVIGVELDKVDYDGMTALAEKVLKKVGDVALILLSKQDDRALLVVACGPQAINAGLEANRLALEVAQGGKGRAGGGREIAQGFVEDLKGARDKIEEIRSKYR
ncbi:MAG: alanine--tRNA ligase [Candidatus Verstraetearchaeota archaeon]|nr:alanine--tRNA ligase [Candidatus Verstraetearchaeota archaeon]